MKAKLFFINALLLVSCSSLFSQTATNDKWKLITTDKNVSIYYEHGTCVNNAAVLFLKVVNNSDQPVTVNWSLWDNKTSKKIQLKPNETITGECVNSMPVFTLTEYIPAGKSDADMHAVITVQTGK